jgi:hypothetical protein
MFNIQILKKIPKKMSKIVILEPRTDNLMPDYIFSDIVIKLLIEVGFVPAFNGGKNNFHKTFNFNGSRYFIRYYIPNFLGRFEYEFFVNDSHNYYIILGDTMYEQMKSLYDYFKEHEEKIININH